MKAPTLIAKVDEDLAAGHACVVQIVSTGEALMERRIAEIPAEGWSDVQVDITPREYVLDYLAHAFPVQLYEPYTDGEGNHRTLTAAMIDSRDFIAARRRAETKVMMPKGAKVAFTGGPDFQDHRAIWAALDRVHAKHADIVLLHGGSPRGAELIAAKWADARRVPQIAFKPDWTRHVKAAPFKRNDALLDVLPIGVVVFPGTGIQDNLADKAR